MTGPLVVLGPQRPEPNLTQALRAHDLRGRVVTITVGWRHDEPDDAPLHQAVRDAGAEPVRLPLYAWFEELALQEPDLHRTYRARQARIRAHKELHRVRLHHALAAVHALRDRLPDDPELTGPELRGALEGVRRLDAELLDRLAALRRESGPPPWEHERVRARRDEAARAIAGASAVLVAGGHVAVIRNRLRFFGLDPVLAQASQEGRAVIAWSAGAMALSERIVLFYDDPPEGPSDPELLDAGLGLLPELVFFPHARRRLRLSDTARLDVLASRFGPRACVGLENGAWLEHRDGGWISRGVPEAAVVLGARGEITPVQGAA